MPSCKMCYQFLSGSNQNRNVAKCFSKNPKFVTQIRLVGVSLSDADRSSDMARLKCPLAPALRRHLKCY